jgi:hypothetical protein
MTAATKRIPVRDRFDKMSKDEKKAFKKAMLEVRSFHEIRKLMGLTEVGFWVEKKEDPRVEGLTWPGDFIDLTWDPAERAKVVEYVKQTREDSRLAYGGMSWCRLCKETAPPEDPKDNRIPKWRSLGSSDFGDGCFVWPEGYVHYIEVHGVKPPQEFIDHILAGGSLK